MIFTEFLLGESTILVEVMWELKYEGTIKKMDWHTKKSLQLESVRASYYLISMLVLNRNASIVFKRSHAPVQFTYFTAFLSFNDHPKISKVCF